MWFGGGIGGGSFPTTLEVAGLLGLSRRLWGGGLGNLGGGGGGGFPPLLVLHLLLVLLVLLVLLLLRLLLLLLLVPPPSPTLTQPLRYGFISLPPPLLPNSHLPNVYSSERAILGHSSTCGPAR